MKPQQHPARTKSFGCRIGKRGVLCCLWLMFLRTEVTKRMVETNKTIKFGHESYFYNLLSTQGRRPKLYKTIGIL
ncbi:hypothetical protein NC651_024201 [Populus alba x Populus x berolinensis]|nr:hypothetical protein NC651_024201 [Populus alba x Populus x berolinensis]